MKILGWVLIYVIAAWLIGFWPFEGGVLTGYSSSCNYDAGYEAGYDGAKQACTNDTYMAGYSAGDFDAECRWLKCVKADHDKFKRAECGSWQELSCF